MCLRTKAFFFICRYFVFRFAVTFNFIIVFRFTIALRHFRFAVDYSWGKLFSEFHFRYYHFQIHCRFRHTQLIHQVFSEFKILLPNRVFQGFWKRDIFNGFLKDFLNRFVSAATMPVFGISHIKQNKVNTSSCSCVTRNIFIIHNVVCAFPYIKLHVRIVNAFGFFCSKPSW